MLRFLFPLVSLAVAAFSIAVEFSPHPADSRICLNGGCRYDQIFTTTATPATAAALLNEAPADPGIWCTYGEFFSGRGDIDKAKVAFERALNLGPGVSSVLMRVANFDFTHDRTEEGLRLAGRILTQTNGFDGILFSYLSISGRPVSQLLGTAIPANARAAHSWLNWIRSQGSSQDMLETWKWMRQNQFGDEKSAADVANTLWQRKAYASAQQTWADWLGGRRGDYRKPQLFANTRFQDDPIGTPFDWKFASSRSVTFDRNEGLDIHFLGVENLTTAGLSQATAVTPGRYRFSVEVSTDNITTDEGLYFQIADVENPGRLSVETQSILGARARSWISKDVVVPSGTRAVQLQILRHPSLKFDNKIKGTLHIYQVSLVPTHSRN